MLMERIPIDPRAVKKIQRSPYMMAEQGAGFLEAWGGPDAYRTLAHLPEPERLTYEAVMEGSTTPSEIEAMTGLTSEQISRALTVLEKKRLVDIAQPE